MPRRQYWSEIYSGIIGLDRIEDAGRVVGDIDLCAWNEAASGIHHAPTDGCACRLREQIRGEQTHTDKKKAEEPFHATVLRRN